MVNSAQPKAQNVQDGGVEALQALFSSLAPQTDGKPSSQLSPEVIKKVSERLTELVGGGGGDGTDQMHNAAGQPLNEEGLPIIDITEPVTDSTEVPAEEGYTTTSIEDEPFIPLSSLSPAERERRRLERDRILDELELEERLQQQREEVKERLREAQEHQARKERVKDDVEKLKSAKDMQKKMGKALLRQLADDREKEERRGDELERRDEERREAKRKAQSDKPAKSVSFAGIPESSQKAVAGGSTKLQSPGPSKTSFDEDQGQRRTMKTSVVERFPMQSSGNQEPSTSLFPAQPTMSTSPLPNDTTEHDDDMDVLADSDTEVDSNAMEEEIDYAQQQRDLAMEYLQRKSLLGPDVLQGMATHSIEDDDDDDWEQENVPLEATLSRPHPKPSQSRFKASQAAAKFASTAVASASASASASQIRTSIRFGRLENDQLVAGPEGDSDGDEQTDGMKEMLDLIKRNDVHNVGPDGMKTQTRQPLETATPPPTKLSRYDPTGDGKQPAFRPTRVSGTVQERNFHAHVVSPPDSRSQTPPSAAARSSPKLPPSPILEAAAASAASAASSLRKAAIGPSVIVDSPSFPSPFQTNSYAPPGEDERPARSKKVSRFLAERG